MRSACRYLVLGLLLLIGCDRSPGQWSPTEPEVPELASLNAAIVFHSSAGKEVAVSGPVAATVAERAQGLMFRKDRLKATESMLFVMDDDHDHGFWMKNTFIPLDMVFVSSAGEVVGIADRVQPHTTQSRSVGRPSRYVIELDAGWCERNSVRTGDRVTISIVPQKS